MKFITASNSIYEIDKENKKIRRFGDPTSTRRVSNDWKSYAKISPVLVGKAVIIFWSDELPTDATKEAMPDGGKYIPFTTTNVVVSITIQEQGILN